MSPTLLLLVQSLVQIHDLSPRDYRVTTFVLDAAQVVRVTAVGAEPKPEHFRNRDEDELLDDAVTTWPAAAWILDARTRAVVWDLRAAATKRETNGLRRFADTLRLPAGVYEAHYASFPAAYAAMDGEFSLRRLATRFGRGGDRFGGPYIDDGLYKQFALMIDGTGRPATPEDIAAARAAFTATAIVTVVPDRNASARQGFELTRPTDVEIDAVGELARDGDGSDYGWIMNADTHQRLWTMAFDNSEPAGGAQKNRMVHETLRLKPGRYVAYFVGDDSHGPKEWNAVPANDPESWGLTLRVKDPAVRAAVRPFNYEPVPAGQTIVSLISMGDHVTRSQGFTLRRPMTVRIYAIGEGFESDMVDYAWVVDATRHKRVWTMSYENTDHAGGAEKNRVFDDTVRLEAGSYLVHYTSDGSHSYNNWNSSPPAEDRFWGVSVFPASGRLNPADVGPFVRGARGTVVAELVRMRNDADARAPFRLTRETRLRVYALGEGVGEDMVDYGWIEDATSGRTMWRMDYAETDPAGGARKNRVFEGVVTLPAGAYVLRYRSDGSHANSAWNDDPPDDPENWGVTVFRMDQR